MIDKRSVPIKYSDQEKISIQSEIESKLRYDAIQYEMDKRFCKAAIKGIPVPDSFVELYANKMYKGKTDLSSYAPALKPTVSPSSSDDMIFDFDEESLNGEMPSLDIGETSSPRESGKEYSLRASEFLKPSTENKAHSFVELVNSKELVRTAG